MFNSYPYEVYALKSDKKWTAFRMLSNDKRISSSFRRDYFVLSFCFENRSYVDIMTVFKVKNKGKRSRPNGEVILLSLLSSKNKI